MKRSIAVLRSFAAAWSGCSSRQVLNLARVVRNAVMPAWILWIGILLFHSPLVAQKAFRVDPESVSFAVLAGNPNGTDAQTVRIINTITDNSYDRYVLPHNANVLVSPDSGKLPAGGSASFSVSLKSAGSLGPANYPSLYGVDIAVMAGTWTVENLHLTIGVTWHLAGRSFVSHVRRIQHG